MRHNKDSISCMILIAASIVAAGQSFTCTPTRIWDRDGPRGFAADKTEITGAAPLPRLGAQVQREEWGPPLTE